MSAAQVYSLKLVLFPAIPKYLSLMIPILMLLRLVPEYRVASMVQVMEPATTQIPSTKETSMVVIPYMVMIIPVIPVDSLMADMQKHLSWQQHSPAPRKARCSERLETA